MVDPASHVADLQLVVALLMASGAVTLWGYVHYHKLYEELALFLKDDGHQPRFAKWRAEQQRQRWIKANRCPDHGTDLNFYRACPTKDCSYTKGSPKR